MAWAWWCVNSIPGIYPFIVLYVSLQYVSLYIQQGYDDLIVIEHIAKKKKDYPSN